MCKCWEEDPYNRVSFAEISSFIGSLLNGETTPAAGSDAYAGYCYYTRHATKDIPDNYLDMKKENNPDEDYIIALPALLESQQSLTTIPNDADTGPLRVTKNDYTRV